MYKTISYPKSESGTNDVERLRFVIANSADSDFVDWLNKLNSRELRLLLVEDYKSLFAAAEIDHKSLSEVTLNKLKSLYNERLISKSKNNSQLDLFINEPNNNGLGRHGTFSPNLIESIHRWYPYIEGFSSTFVETLIKKWSNGAKTIYDPFAGTGTTLTVASINEIKGYYSEVNPFMRLVINCKTNLLKQIVLNNEKGQLKKYLYEIIDHSVQNKVSQIVAQQMLDETFPGRPFFVKQRLIDIISLKEAIAMVIPANENYVSIAKLALGSIGVMSSEMKRASDLRYRRENEILPDSFDVMLEYKRKVDQILNDITDNLLEMSPTEFVGSNALYSNNITNKIDLVLTSPPYLNGTNYFRNTKIELWLAGLIKHEKELVEFNRQAMIAGINNVSKNSRKNKKYSFVEKIVTELEKVAYDRRIPELVRGYCSDSELWLANCNNMLSENGKIVVDIGDSKFAGVHIPTDKFLIEIASELNLELIDTEVVRKRNSNDGTELKQVLLAFQKKALYKNMNKLTTRTEIIEKYKNSAIEFQKLPYKKDPYGSRNWGHSLHSLCSYQGKLKPAIAHFLVKYFTEEKEFVLDPMSGSGTVPLEAFLNNRVAIAGDIQKLGYILSLAKINKPDAPKVLNEVDSLMKYIKNHSKDVDISKYSEFGLNGKIPEYFQEKTLREVLCAREYLLKNECATTERAIVYSSLLHILHGNRPYALSRRSHPVTPFKPQGEFEYRDIESRIYSKVARSLESYDKKEYSPGRAHFSAFEDLDYEGEIDAIITSPPFTASTRFYSANWMRLWMSGWEPEDFKGKKDNFLEEKQKKSLDIYYEFFKKSHKWLKPNGKLILHLGKTKKVDMANELMKRCGDYFEVIHTFDEDVAGREKFGIRDQGATSAHQYLFLIRK